MSKWPRRGNPGRDACVPRAYRCNIVFFRKARLRGMDSNLSLGL